MSTRIMIRHLVVIRHILANQSNYSSSEIQQTFEASNFVLQEHLNQLKECINTLELIREQEKIPCKKDEFSLIIHNLHQLF